MKPVFDIRTSKQDKPYFVLQARNAEIILTSEEYESKQGLQKGIASVKHNVLRRGAFKRSVAINGEFYFTLRANNNKTIGVSEMYTSKFGREVGIASVRVNSKLAK